MTYEALIDLIFDYCVELLVVLARYIGMTYEEINVWFFIVIEPILFALLGLYAIHQRQQIHTLKNRLKPIESQTHNTGHSCSGYLVSSRNS